MDAEHFDSVQETVMEDAAEEPSEMITFSGELIHHMRKSALITCLKELGLNTRGNKEELQQRFRDHLVSQPGGSASAVPRAPKAMNPKPSERDCWALVPSPVSGRMVWAPLDVEPTGAQTSLDAGASSAAATEPATDTTVKPQFEVSDAHTQVSTDMDKVAEVGASEEGAKAGTAMDECETSPEADAERGAAVQEQGAEAGAGVAMDKEESGAVQIEAVATSGDDQTATAKTAPSHEPAVTAPVPVSVPVPQQPVFKPRSAANPPVTVTVLPCRPTPFRAPLHAPPFQSPVHDMLRNTFLRSSLRKPEPATNTESSGMPAPRALALSDSSHTTQRKLLETPIGSKLASSQDFGAGFGVTGGQRLPQDFSFEPEHVGAESGAGAAAASAPAWQQRSPLENLQTDGHSNMASSPSSAEAKPPPKEKEQRRGEHAEARLPRPPENSRASVIKTISLNLPIIDAARPASCRNAT